jgi:hypothetical protein
MVIRMRIAIAKDTTPPSKEGKSSRLFMWRSILILKKFIDLRNFGMIPKIFFCILFKNKKTLIIYLIRKTEGLLEINKWRNQRKAKAKKC